MKPTLWLILMSLIATGCTSQLKLSARRWDVMRPDGTASVRALVVTDQSLPAGAYEAVALCVLPPGAQPLDWTEDLAGACAAGCELLMVAPPLPDESRVEDHLLVLRRFLETKHNAPKSVIVIGVRAGDAMATTIANREGRVTHLALLAPQQVVMPDVPQPTFIARIGGIESAPARPNVTLRHYPVADLHWREPATGRTIRPLVEMDLIAWLTDTGALTNDRAVALAHRVRRAHREWYEAEQD
jgi:hypothetical protein